MNSVDFKCGTLFSRTVAANEIEFVHLEKIYLANIGKYITTEDQLRKVCEMYYLRDANSILLFIGYNYCCKEQFTVG